MISSHSSECCCTNVSCSHLSVESLLFVESGVLLALVSLLLDVPFLSCLAGSTPLLTELLLLLRAGSLWDGLSPCGLWDCLVCFGNCGWEYSVHLSLSWCSVHCCCQKWWPSYNLKPFDHLPPYDIGHCTFLLAKGSAAAGSPKSPCDLLHDPFEDHLV